MNIKRPIVLFLGGTGIGIILAYNRLPICFKLAILIIAIFLYGKLLINKLCDKKNSIGIIALIVVILFGVLGFYRFRFEENKYDNWTKNVLALGKGTKTINGVVNVIGKSTNSNYYDLIDCTSNGYELGTCRCYVNDNLMINNGVKIGNYISVDAGTSVIEGPTNEGEFNQKNYYRSIGISFIAFARNITIVNNRVSVVKQKIYEIKLVIKAQIQKILNVKDAGLFSAMVTGDKSSIDKEQKRLFSDNGIAHILAISGLHLSILGLAVFEILRKRFSVNVAAGVVSVFILLYGIFIDAGATSLRAITMLYVRFLSLAIGRTYDSKNTLYIICFIFLMLKPYLLFNAGFQFSYVAILALNTDVRIQLINRANVDDTNADNEALKVALYKKRYIKVPVTVTLTLFLFPITIYHYFTYPLYQIFLNLIVIPLMAFVLGFGLWGVIISFLNLTCGQVLVMVVHIIFLLYDKLCYFIETLPYHTLLIGRPNIYYVLYYYVALFLVIYLINHSGDENKKECIKSVNVEVREKVETKAFANGKNRLSIVYGRVKKTSIILAMLLLILSVLVILKKDRNDFRMTFMSIGQGDSILIEANDVILAVDGGSTTSQSNGQYIYEPHIKSRAIDHIDYVFISHPDADHTNAIMYLIENVDEVKVKNIILPQNAIEDKGFNKLKMLAQNYNIPISYVKANDVMNITDEIKIDVISPSIDVIEENRILKKSKKLDANEMSLTFKISYKDRSALFTGDIGKEMESRIVKDDSVQDKLSVDVLKVPHHGSKNSNHAAFFKKVHPKYSVISYGKGNSYGHPHDITIKSLEYLDSKILKTGESGQIDIYFDGGEIRYKTFLK